jgi:LPXTG-motif cell wall-anchored protein
MLYEEYKEAYGLYQLLYRVNPTNDNIKYRMGQCLINMPGEKEKAIPLLEAAVKNINPNYKEGKIKETKAPFDAYYYLANAYRINNQLDKALEAYNLFKKNLDPKVYDTSIVNMQIESCLNARELLKVPLFIRKQNLGPVINERYPEINPVVSADENIMVFNRVEPLQVALYFTKRTTSGWTQPVNIIPDLGLGFDDKNYATSLSGDGRELYIYRAGEDYDGNIFVTKRGAEDRWSNLVKLNENINTKFWESHASISPDGKKLYFTSNRKGAIGGLDIYVSERDTANNWGPAVNLGPAINTEYNEESPFIGQDGKTLYFSSRGHFNIGGYDIFYTSLMENGQWSVPLNVGYPLNSTDDDVFFNPSRDGYNAFYAIEGGGYGGSDIFKIEIFSKDHPRKFFVRGLVQVKDLLSVFGDSVKVSAFSDQSPEARVVVYADPKTGEFKFELPQGKYTVTYEAKGAEKMMQDLNLELTHPSDSFVLPGTTLPKTDFTAEMNIGDNKNISVAKGDTVFFPIKTEPNSVLTVKHWLGDSLLSTQIFTISDTAFVYGTAPKTGKNRIEFSLTDKFNNTTTSEVLINREKVIIDQKIVRPEYAHVIARKQVTAFAEMLRNRADKAEVRNLIKNARLERQQFGKVDDIVSYLKEEAIKARIEPVELDMLSLKVAVLDNVLTQAATDLVKLNAYGELNEILSGLNIYDAGIKTWTALQEYVADRSSGRIKPEDLNKLASDILSGRDSAIDVIREKLNSASEVINKGNILREAVSVTDKKDIRKTGPWLRSVYEEAQLAKMNDKELSLLLSALTALKGTDPADYLKELAVYADTKCSEWIAGLDPSDLKAENTYQVVLYLMKNRKTAPVPEDDIFGAIGRMIAAKDFTPEIISSNLKTSDKNNLFFLWLVMGIAGLFLIFFLYRRRKKKKSDEQAA